MQTTSSLVNDTIKAWCDTTAGSVDSPVMDALVNALTLSYDSHFGFKVKVCDVVGHKITHDPL